MSKKEKTHFRTLHGSGMLHPATCGSSIRWTAQAHKAYSRRVFDGTVFLTDCDRQIKWGGWGEGGPRELLEKINNAIHILTEARAGIQEIEKHYNRIPMRKAKK